MLFDNSLKALQISLHGPNSSCPGVQQTYSFDAYTDTGISLNESNCTITWTVHEDGVLVYNNPLGGQTLNYTFGDFQGTAVVKVTVGSCGLPSTGGTAQKSKNVSIQLVKPGPISGPSKICTNTWEEFSVPFWDNDAGDCYFHYSNQWVVPSGWSLNDLSDVVSPDRVEIKAPSSASGNYTIKVRGVNHPAGSTPYRTFNVFVGKPTTVEIAGSSHQACENDFHGFGATGASGATSYNWTLPSGWGFSGSSSSKNITATTTTTGGNVSVQAVNSCGTSNTDVESVSVIDCGGGHLMVMYPNPTSEELSFVLDESFDQASGNLDNEKGDASKFVNISIVDENGDVWFQEKFVLSDGLTLDTSSFKPGKYYVHIDIGGNKEVRHLIVE